MKRILRISTLACLIMSISACVLQAEDVNKIMDKFYDGMAGIIERNMDNPDRCVSEVDDYYKENQATVEKVRKLTEKGMKQAMDMMGEYESMSEEELEALERQAMQKGMTESQMPPGLERYTEAMEKLMMKSPQQALKIAMMAMQFMPKIEGMRE
ncbi:MAG: hypothetical protein U9R52_02165 [Candidatus Omnitrophota bacterium]|nr:hypothetical protein [Candidatus Omnitrophota bacterium]